MAVLAAWTWLDRECSGNLLRNEPIRRTTIPAVNRSVFYLQHNSQPTRNGVVGCGAGYASARGFKRFPAQPSRIVGCVGRGSLPSVDSYYDQPSPLGRDGGGVGGVSLPSVDSYCDQCRGGGGVGADPVSMSDISYAIITEHRSSAKLVSSISHRPLRFVCSLCFTCVCAMNDIRFAG